MEPAPEREAEGKEGCPSILIVDPDLRIAEALALALKQRAQVDWGTRGTAGLLLAAEKRADFVIAGTDLPDISSGDFVRLLRLLRPHVRVGFLGTNILGSKAPGADVYFPHPIQLKRLLDWIEGCLDQSASPEAGQIVMAPPVRYEIAVPHLEIVRSVLEFIDGSYQDGAPLSRMAQAAGVSRSHLCRIFKKITGLSLKRFLTRRRLQAAKELLLEPGATIDQVARQVGYRDASHFDRVFRQWEGRTPSGYRRQAILRAFRNGVRATHDDQLFSSPNRPREF